MIKKYGTSVPSALVAARRSIRTDGGLKALSPPSTSSGSAVISPLPKSTRKLWVGEVTDDSPTNTSSWPGWAFRPISAPPPTSIGPRSLPSGRESGEPRLRVDQMGHHEAVAGGDRVHQRMLGLGQHLAPLGRSGPAEVLEIQAHQPAAFGVEIGAQEERVAVDPDQREFRQRLVDDLDRLTESAPALIIEDRIEPEPVAVLGALDDAHRHVVIIFGDLRPEDQLVVVGKLQDQLVVVLIITDAVDPQCRRRQCRRLGAVRRCFMIKMDVAVGSAVGQPFGSRELGLDRHVVHAVPPSRGPAGGRSPSRCRRR